jgi:hypothetical protein
VNDLFEPSPEEIAALLVALEVVRRREREGSSSTADTSRWEMSGRLGREPDPWAGGDLSPWSFPGWGGG